MKTSPEYFQGAAAVTARFSHKLKGSRRKEAIDKAAAGVCRQGMKRADFDALVEQSEKRLRAR